MWSDEIYEDSLKPLRVCRTCGKEAYTYGELCLFMKDYKSHYNRKNKCMACNAKDARDKRKSNPEHRARQNSCCKNNYLKNKEIRNKVAIEYHNIHRDIQNAKRREHYIQHREENRIRRKFEEYLGKARFTSSERRRLQKGTYNKLSPEDKQKIKQLFLQASLLSSITQTKWVVDHIIPLKSNFVCGLHIPENMQLLEDTTNNIKNNYLGYLGQYNLSTFYTMFNKKPKRKDIFSKLGVSMTYSEFLEYEKTYYKEYV